jgi:hypothetical protein
MPELRMLLLDLPKFGLPLLQSAVIAAPREDSVRAGDRMAGECADDDHRQGWHCHPADQPENTVRSSRHDVKRIMSDRKAQVKRMIWWMKRG